MTSNLPDRDWDCDENIPNSLGRDEIRSFLRELAEPREVGDPVKAAIDRAARRASLSYWRAFDIWYGKARRVEQFEIDQITDALDKRRREVARNELHDLQARIARLEARLSQTDPDFHRPHLDGLRQGHGGQRALVPGLGGIGRPARAKT